MFGCRACLQVRLQHARHCGRCSVVCWTHANYRAVPDAAGHIGSSAGPSVAAKLAVR
jgi:hypothetical protein